MVSKDKKSLLWRINLLISLAGGLVALWGISLTPSETQTAILWGYSTARVTLFLIIILGLTGIALLLRKSLQPDFWDGEPGRKITAFLEKYGPYLGVLLLGISYVALFASNQQLGVWGLYRERLYPVFLWTMMLGFQILVTLIIMNRNKCEALHLYKHIFFRAFTLWGLLILVALAIKLTRIGLNPDAVYWQDAGSPLLFWQVLASWAAGSLLFLLPEFRIRLQNFLNLRHLGKLNVDVCLCIAIWLFAFMLWGSYPVRPSYNALPPRAPNFESYPFGDAIIFDIDAQNFLIGNPIPNDFWHKPFYSFFLTILHALAGQNYELVTTVQVGVLAFIPVIVFLLTKTFSNRATGVVAASLIIFREINALSLSNVIQISHSKLLMSDVFSMGLMALLIWLLVLWLKDPDRHRWLPLVTGGAFGILVMTRGHTLMLLPFIVLASVIVLIPAKQLRRSVEGIAILLIGLSIPLGTWVLRNYQWTGNFILQDNVSPYTVQIARLYSLTPLESPPRLTGEDEAAYYGRIVSQPINFVFEHPKEVVNFVSAHYIHNTVFSIIYLPNSLAVEGTIEYVKRMPFWRNWDGQLATEARMFLGFNLLILSLGIIASYQRAQKLIFIPFLLGVGYNLSVSIGRLSGWRLILPADWITLIFYSVGLAQLTILIQALLSKKGAQPVHPTKTTMPNGVIAPWSWTAFSGVIVVILGLSLGLTQGHKLATVKYPPKTSSEILQDYRQLVSDQQQAISVETLNRFLEQEGAVALYGRGLYPSYMPINAGELNYFHLAFAPRPYKRLVFQLIGPEEIGVVLPLSSPPKTFPNTTDVIVFGCNVENEYASSLPGYVDALAVVIKSDPPVIYAQDSVGEFGCAFPTS